MEPDEIRARVAGRIREIAARRKVNLTELASRAGISRSHLYTVLDGERSATTDLLTKLAKALRVDPVEFLRPVRTRSKAKPSDPA